MRQTLQNKLSQLELFDGINEFSFLTRCIHPTIQRLRPGENLNWGERSVVALLVEGVVSVDGARFSEGSLVGATSAFSGTPVPLVKAATQSVLMMIPTSALTEVCSSACACHKQLVRNTIRLLSNHIILQEQRLHLLGIAGIRKRISTYLLQLRRDTGKDMVTLPGNRKEMASYLNLARPSLSRELCLMRDEGLLEFYRESIKLLEVKKLSELLN